MLSYYYFLIFKMITCRLVGSHSVAAVFCSHPSCLNSIKYCPFLCILLWILPELLPVLLVFTCTIGYYLYYWLLPVLLVFTCTIGFYLYYVLLLVLLVVTCTMSYYLYYSRLGQSAIIVHFIHLYQYMELGITITALKFLYIRVSNNYLIELR